MTLSIVTFRFNARRILLKTKHFIVYAAMCKTEFHD